jgi:hypothetical protein
VGEPKFLKTMSKKKWELRLFLKEEDLRSASYNFLSDHPTGRADAINLKMWLLSKLQ